MRVLELPSYSEQMELLPMRYSEPFVNANRRKPRPEEFTGRPKPKAPVNDLSSLPRRRDDPRGYMREYMRRQRAARRQAIA